MWDTAVDKYLWLFKKESIWLEEAMTGVLLGNRYLCNLVERKSAELLARLARVSVTGECSRQLGNGGLFSFKVMPWLGTKTAEKAGEEGVGTNHHQLQAGLSILEGTQKALKSIQDDSHH